MTEAVPELVRLTEMAETLFDAETEVVRVQAELRSAQQKVTQLVEHDIPELMDTLQLEEFRTKSGLRVAVADKLSAKKLTQAHAAALKWLRDNDQGGLIKTIVGVPFSAGEENGANDLVEWLEGEGLLALKSIEVHHSSLAAAIRTMLADGIDVPMELLGGYQRRVASIETKKR